MYVNKCTNLIKISLKLNKKGFIIKNSNNSKTINILKAFMKINIIKFIKIKDSVIIVYLNYNSENKPIFNNVLNIYKPSQNKFIKLKTLKEIEKKHNWIFLLSTNKGILTSYEAIKNNVGGLLLTKIWN